MTKHLPGLAIAVLSLQTGITLAADRSVNIGPGSAMCAEFDQEFASLDKTTSLAYYYWAEGYMSGIQATLPEEEQVDLFPRGFNAQQQIEFIRAFCASNPLHTYGVAVERLYEAIRKSNGRGPILNLPR